MYAITPDLNTLVGQVERGEADIEKLVVIEESPDYPGTLLFQPVRNRQDFFNRYHSWFSHRLVLNELYSLPSLVDKLCEDGYEPVFGPSCEATLVNLMRWWVPLHIDGYDLHPFQQFGLRRALESGFWFWNWSTGSGKSFCSAAGARELFDRDEIDLVIAATMSKSKEDLRRFFEHAKIDAVVNDGTKAKRRKVYAENHACYVINYERFWVDYDELAALCKDQRVLFVLDEVHKIIYSPLNKGTPNKARRAYEHLSRLCYPKVWPMSASVVNGNPLRFRDVFSLANNFGHPDHPLGTPREFLDRYASEIKDLLLEQPSGAVFSLTVVKWDTPKLTEIRHRVENLTQAVRKTDPGVREYFKGIQTVVEPVQFSPQERELADFIVDRAWDAWCDRGAASVNLGPYYTCLRLLCNTPEALRVTEFQPGKDLMEARAELVARASSTKLAKLNEMLEIIRESGDKVVVFTHWTSLGLHLIAPHISVPHVLHFGVGQTDTESQEAKERFMTDPEITCFLSSDAGSHGLNLTAARYVIQYEPTYSYDDGMQRASRIDRADSHLDGLTNYVMVTEDSVEERVWNIQQDRRVISSATQGTEEPLSYSNRERALATEAANIPWLIFGDRML